MKRDRVIDRLRQDYPDRNFSWRWDQDERAWVNTELNAIVRREARMSMCCMDACDHYRAEYRITIDKYGPWRWDYPQYVASDEKRRTYSQTIYGDLSTYGEFA